MKIKSLVLFAVLGLLLAASPAAKATPYPYIIYPGLDPDDVIMTNWFWYGVLPMGYFPPQDPEDPNGDEAGQTTYDEMTDSVCA